MKKVWTDILQDLDRRTGAHGTGHEAPVEGTSISITDAAINSRVDQLTTQLSTYAKTWLQPGVKTCKLIKKLEKESKRGLVKYREDRKSVSTDVDAMKGIESVVRLDNSRPSFLVAQDKIIFESSFAPADDWKSFIQSNRTYFESALKFVGRIENSSGINLGTGVQISGDLLLTNAHVLQLFAEETNGTWKIDAGQKIWIDFGHEYTGQNGSLVGRKTWRRREIIEIVYAPKNYADRFSVNHALLDLVLLRLQASSSPDDSPGLGIDLDADLARNASPIFVIGYPLLNKLGTTEEQYRSYFEELFSWQSDIKRVSIGESLPTSLKWSMQHDASTLGGNSGSLLCHTTRSFPTTSAIHYAGEFRTANYAHLIGKVLDEPDSQQNTLRKILRKEGVQEIS